MKTSYRLTPAETFRYVAGIVNTKDYLITNCADGVKRYSLFSLGSTEEYHTPTSSAVS